MGLHLDLKLLTVYTTTVTTRMVQLPATAAIEYVTKLVSLLVTLL